MSELKRGLLVMHYGTPASIEAVEPYYTHIRHGRPPSPEQLQDLVDRYKAIGGPSPLTRISRDQGGLIQKGLARRDIHAELYIGTKHTHPFISDVVAQMAQDGVEEAVGVVLAPHFSTFSIAQYKKYAFESREANSPQMKLALLERWGTLPEFIGGLAERVGEQMAGWDPAETLVIFSAHSLPMRALAAGDPYPEELMETSRLVADKLGIPRWTFAYQSASSTGEPWLGPDILDVIDRQAAGKVKHVLSCTVGFISDHLEVLYDLGIEARERCEHLGLDFRVARVINADDEVMDALAGQLVPLFCGLAAAV
jgi:ferrochelatase